MRIRGRGSIQLIEIGKTIDDELAKVNSELVVYDETSAELLLELMEGTLDPLIYDSKQSAYDQAYQAPINRRNRLLGRRSKISSELAKVVLTRAVLK